MCLTSRLSASSPAPGSNEKLECLKLPCRAATDEDATAQLESDRELQQALQRSKRAGDLLLKAEEEELQSVERLVKDLLQNEYRYVQPETGCS